MSEYIVQSSSLQAVADKIREKTGDSAPLEFPDEFITGIEKITAPPDTPMDSILFYSKNEFSLGVANKTKNWQGSLYYSFDHIEWVEWTGSENIEAEYNGRWFTIYLKGLNNNAITGSVGNDRRFVMHGSSVKCVGNLINLLNKSGSPNYTNCFNYLFYNMANVDFDVELPATIIENRGGFMHMFEGCASLTKAPDLSSTVLTANCYQYMFAGCTSLKNAPALPAQTLDNGCYAYMFYNCESLIEPPLLPAATVPAYAYQWMFAGCLSLKKCPKLSATSITTSSYQDMFNGCKLLEQLPALPAATLGVSCYRNMFSGCSSIKISSSQIGEYETSYRIPFEASGTDASSALNNMFLGTGGTFTGTPTINTTYYTSNTVIPAT